MSLDVSLVSLCQDAHHFKTCHQVFKY